MAGEGDGWIRRNHTQEPASALVLNKMALWGIAFMTWQDFPVDFIEEGNPGQTKIGNSWVKASKPQDRDPVSLSAAHPN